MTEHLLHGPTWQPLQAWGLTAPFWTIQLDTLISTSVILGIIIVGSMLVYWSMHCHKKTAYIITQYCGFFYDLVKQSMHKAPFEHIAFIASLFTFILMCNTISIIPWLEEPTKDLNTTLALGLIAFFYVHGNSIATNGIKEYIADYFKPFFIMFPLNLIGAVTSVISLAFRLFGNIFGGFIITTLYKSLVGSSLLLQITSVVIGANLAITAVFSIFEGLIQAFVFAMLTITYLSMEIAEEEEEELV